MGWWNAVNDLKAVVQLYPGASQFCWGKVSFVNPVKKVTSVSTPWRCVMPPRGIELAYQLYVKLWRTRFTYTAIAPLLTSTLNVGMRWFLWCFCKCGRSWAWTVSFDSPKACTPFALPLQFLPSSDTIVSLLSIAVKICPCILSTWSVGWLENSAAVGFYSSFCFRLLTHVSFSSIFFKW